MSGQRRPHCPPCACPCTTAWHSQPCPRESGQPPPPGPSRGPHLTPLTAGGLEASATQPPIAFRLPRLPPSALLVRLAWWLAVPSAWGPAPLGAASPLQACVRPHFFHGGHAHLPVANTRFHLPAYLHPFPSFSFHNIFTYATCIALTTFVHFFILLFCLPLLKHIEEDKQTICVSSGQ